MNAPVRNGLSVDVEEWFQVGAFEKVIAPTEWDGLESRVERNVMAILEMFGRAGVTGTFFTLGWIAARHPALVRRIAEAGHEVASHGWAHDRVFTLDAQRFAADLARARDALEQASGQSVTGYRAPSFSIDARTPWAHRRAPQPVRLLASSPVVPSAARRAPVRRCPAPCRPARSAAGRHRSGCAARLPRPAARG